MWEQRRGFAMQLRGTTALVTGASSGIGEAIARELAARGADVILAARRRDRLDAIAASLREAYGTRVDVVALDLGATEAADRLYAQTEGAGRAVDILVNNAGFGSHDNFVDIPWERTLAQLQLNVVTLTELTHRFCRAMLARDRGWILNVASVGAYAPVPSYATYAAGKAYVRSFTEALAHELRATRVRVCCLNPGATATEFMRVAGHEVPSFARFALMSSERCARIGLRALFCGRRNVVAGWSNVLATFLLRFLPRVVATWVSSLAMSAPPPVRRAALGGGPQRRCALLGAGSTR
jgi:short-subunit dehydrogenase